MCAYKYMTKIWKKAEKSFLEDIIQNKVIKWRKSPSIERVDKPTRPDKARRLGYKAKQGFICVKVKIRKGGARKQRPSSGRRPKAMGVKKYTRAKSLKKIAQERVLKKYPNLILLNSYWLYEDGKHAWYEVIMADPTHQVLRVETNVMKTQKN